MKNGNEKTEELTVDANNGNDVNDILRLSVKVCFKSVSALVFISMLFLFLAPYRAMLFFNGLNMKERALDFAEGYVRHNESRYAETPPEYDSKFADSLLYCVNTSISLMNSAVERCGATSDAVGLYAEKADKYTGSFINYGLDKRIKLIDDYSIANTVVSFRPYVYSFKDDITAAQIRAKVFGGNKVAAGEFISKEFSKLTLPLDADFDSDDLRESATVIGCISAYTKAIVLIENGKDDGLLSKNGKVTDFYVEFIQYIEQVKTHLIDEMEGETNAGRYLEKLYGFRRLVEAADGFSALAKTDFSTADGFDLDFWQELNRVNPLHGDEKTLNEYFILTLLYNYSQLLY